MNNDKCPKCGGNINHIMFASYPPIPVEECASCGYRTENGRVVNSGSVSIDDVSKTGAIESRTMRTILFVDDDGGIVYDGNHRSVKEAMMEYVHKNFGTHHFKLTQILCKLDDCDTDLIINVYNKWEPDLPIKKYTFVIRYMLLSKAEQ